jgi:hypothetical protein
VTRPPVRVAIDCAVLQVRFVSGLCNANAANARASITDVTDPSNRAQALAGAHAIHRTAPNQLPFPATARVRTGSGVGAAFAVARVGSSALSGLTSHLSLGLPILEREPYLLPCMAAALLCVFTLVRLPCRARRTAARATPSNARSWPRYFSSPRRCPR